MTTKAPNAPKPEAPKAEPKPKGDDAPKGEIDPPAAKPEAAKVDAPAAEAEPADDGERKHAAFLVLPASYDGKDISLIQTYPVLGTCRSVTVGGREFKFRGVFRNEDKGRTENRLAKIDIASADELTALLDAGWTQE